MKTILMLASLTAGFLAMEAHAQSQPVTRTQGELIRIVDQMRALSQEQASELHAAVANNQKALEAQAKAESALFDALGHVAYLRNQIAEVQAWGRSQQAARNAALVQAAASEASFLEEKQAHQKTRSAYLRLKVVASLVIGFAVAFLLLPLAANLGPYGLALPIGGGIAAATAIYFLT